MRDLIAFLEGCVAAEDALRRMLLLIDLDLHTGVNCRGL
jgi:hypothetical protein